MSPAQCGRSPLALTLALVAALVALGALAWFVARGGATRRFEVAKRAQVERASDAPAELVVDPRAATARSVETIDASASATSSAPAASSGTGTLRLRVLDETTRAPVPDLAFVVYRERGGNKELAKGRTDADGRAELREIEANTVIVRTERKPPYAETYGAVWLTPGATKELELLTGAGGAFIGRIIDDTQKPIAGATIWLAEVRENSAPDTTSGMDGRFRLECLAPHPRSVWIVDGEMRPETWEEVLLTARSGLAWNNARGVPKAGKEIDLGDIVVPRTISYSGRLLDAHGSPVDGAVIRCGGGLQHGPAEPDFKLGPTDFLTSGGAFELREVPELFSVDVWTRDGIHQRLRMPAARPGERIDGIVLRLAPELRIELQLVDESGARAPVPAPRRTGFDKRFSAAAFDAGRVLEFRAHGQDGALLRTECEHSDTDGIWRAAIAVDPARITELEILATGYLPLHEFAPAGFPTLVRRKLVLERKPVVRVHLVAKDPAAKLLREPGASISLRACLADPEKHARAQGRCCGFGSMWLGAWRGDPVDIELPVKSREPFWIYLRTFAPAGKAGRMSALGYAGGAESDPRPEADAYIGPFAPGEDLREFPIDTTKLPEPGEEPERKPPPRNEPGEDESASLRAHIVDESTGKGIAAWIWLVEEATIPNSGRNARVECDSNGDANPTRIPSGTWRVEIGARGYKPLQFEHRETHRDATLDLGTLALEPLPVHRGRVLDSLGHAPERGALGLVGGTGELSTPAQLDRGDGSFELFGELPEHFVLQVLVPAQYKGRGADVQRFVVERWPQTEVMELRLRASRRVLVTVGGVAPDEAELAPSACLAPGEPGADCDHRSSIPVKCFGLTRGLRTGSTADGQRFALQLAPGKYVLWGSNVLHELPVTDLELAAGDTDVELTLGAH